MAGNGEKQAEKEVEHRTVAMGSWCRIGQAVCSKSSKLHSHTLNAAVWLTRILSHFLGFFSKRYIKDLEQTGQILQMSGKIFIQQNVLSACFI